MKAKAIILFSTILISSSTLAHTHEMMLATGMPLDTPVKANFTKDRHAVSHYGTFAEIIEIINDLVPKGWTCTLLQREPSGTPPFTERAPRSRPQKSAFE